jgi:hypothetical protein
MPSIVIIATVTGLIGSIAAQAAMGVSLAESARNTLSGLLILAPIVGLGFAAMAAF